MYDFRKIFFFKKSCLCKINIFVSPFKKFNSVKKTSSVKNSILKKLTHSVKHECYYQFRFATNEQV